MISIHVFWQWRPIWWDWARILVSNEMQCWYCNLMWTSAVSACTLLHQLQCGVGSMWVYPHQLPPPMPSQFRTMIVVLTIANISTLLLTMMMINIYSDFLYNSRWVIFFCSFHLITDKTEFQRGVGGKSFSNWECHKSAGATYYKQGPKRAGRFSAQHHQHFQSWL